MTTAIRWFGILVVMATVTVIIVAFNPAKPEFVGEARAQLGGKYDGVIHFEQPTRWTRLPMWIQYDRHVAERIPMIGYIRLVSTNDIQYLTNKLGLDIVGFGNLADQRYMWNTLPMYAPGYGFWNPNSIDEFQQMPPKEFLVAVWLDPRRKGDGTR